MAPSAARRIAALDVGTNTVLMLVVERRPDGTLVPLADMARITRLGRGVERTGHLDPAAARATLDAIVEFANRARELEAESIVAVATAALRDVADGAAFLTRVREEAGIELTVISGETEAQLSYLAVVRGLGLDASGRLLIVDIGGGSTEFIRVEPGAELQAFSLQLGSVRLTERHIHHDPPAPGEVAALRATIDAAIDSLNWSYRPDLMVGIAGTATTVCAVALKLVAYDSNLVHGYRLSRGEVGRSLELFGTLPNQQRRLLPGLAEGRVDVIFAGTAILERVMARFDVEQVVISDQGVRWGLAWRELERAGS
ncbi:MAG TPA: Ppx/GppA phosphatase family protein [Candidatus Binataceae bacterium]|nr:Ppx/GppA phosphatase family protein [Candidatus Binataceae bacterium]